MEELGEFEGRSPEQCVEVQSGHVKCLSKDQSRQKKIVFQV